MRKLRPPSLKAAFQLRAAKQSAFEKRTVRKVSTRDGVPKRNVFYASADVQTANADGTPRIWLTPNAGPYGGVFLSPGHT